MRCALTSRLTPPPPPTPLQDLSSLKLPAAVNSSADSVACTTQYGRTYYLTFQFTFLAFLILMQVRACGGGVRGVRGALCVGGGLAAFGCTRGWFTHTSVPTTAPLTRLH